MKITDVALILSTPKMGSTTITVLCLSCEPEMTMSKISSLVGISTAGLTGAADQLEKHGLAERKIVQGDRRALHLTATLAGRMLVNQMQRKLDALQEV